MKTILFLLVLSMYQSSADSNCLWNCAECVRGWYGVRCEKRCIGVCDSGGCHRNSGQCLQCRGGYYSSNCTTKCPLLCRKSKDGYAHCHRVTGYCLENCEVGWWGDRCDRACREGCADNSCYPWDGTCDKGCHHGWTGDDCGNKCPSGCRHNACEPSGKGRCTEGCNNGSHGHHCELNCLSNCQACRQVSGLCVRCSHGYYGDTCERYCGTDCAMCDMKNTDVGCDDVCATLCLNNATGTPGSPSAGHTYETNTSNRCGEGFLLPLVTVLFLNIF